MSDVVDTVLGWPWWWAWLALYAIVTLRAGATYALGRALAAGLLRRRVPAPSLRTAAASVQRWGPPAVTLSFLTVGAQTVVNAGAGAARLSVPRYLLGLLPGAAVWATLWTTVGAGVLVLVRRAADGHAGAQAVVVAAALTAVAVALVASRRRRDRLDGMSENVIEPDDNGWEKSEELDQMQPEDTLVDRGVDDVLDEGYSPPEKWSPGEGFGSTAAETAEGETLDQRLAQEVPEPDPYGDVDPEAPAGDEVGEVRSGRLVDPDGGIGEDTEKSLVGDDVGIDGAAASAEEAAVHVVEDHPDEPARP